MDQNEQLVSDTKESKVDIFLLTKPPHSARTRFCLQLIAQSEKAILYLAGDGVFNLLEKDLEALPQDRILASKEDLHARGVQAGDKAIVPSDFYEQMVGDVTYERRRLYTF